MKKLLSLTLAAAMTLSLAACGGKSEAAKSVDEQITAIGEVTLDSESKISAAEEAVAALAEEDKKQLDNLDALAQARVDYDALVLEAQADEIEAAISAIGTVTLESGDAISSAESAYSSAPAEVQALVENASAIEEAKVALGGLRAAQAEEMIAAIGEVTLERADAISEAQAVYDALSSEEKGRVTNAGVLEAAAASLKELKQAEAEKLLSNMRVESDEVRGMSFYYSKTHPIYADTRCYVLPYIGRQGDNTWLCAEYLYTEDDWIFFNKITFAVDNERYYKFASRSDLIRDHDNGLVWEYINTGDVSESDIEVFWAIANSEKTVVRFEGDEYYYDFTVSAKDKAAIREVLTAYEALK